jgi:hypothetical protein
VKPRDEYVIVKTMGWSNTDAYYMERRYVLERYAKHHGLTPDTSRYVAEGLSYKQAKRMMKLFKEQ